MKLIFLQLLALLVALVHGSPRMCCGPWALKSLMPVLASVSLWEERPTKHPCRGLLKSCHLCQFSSKRYTKFNYDQENTSIPSDYAGGYCFWLSASIKGFCPTSCPKLYGDSDPTKRF